MAKPACRGAGNSRCSSLKAFVLKPLLWLMKLIAHMRTNLYLKSFIGCWVVAVFTS